MAAPVAKSKAAHARSDVGDGSTVEFEPRNPLPAWLISVIFHVILIVAAAMTIQLRPVGMKADDSTTIGGEIVLKQMTDEGEKYYTEESANALDQLVDAPSSDPLADAPSVTPSINPLELDAIGPTAATGNSGNGGGLSEIISNPGQPRAAGHTSRTTFMSMTAEGSSFVYLIDRSASMGDGHVGSRLNYAVTQAQASLRHLDEHTRFQILFYNHDILPFRIAGKSEQMYFATEQNKTLAGRFLGGVGATGNTESAQAILKALAYGPDVVFFLSDSQSNLNYIDLESIRRKNNGGSVSINVIEFAPTQGDAAKNNLRKLAQQNNGEYRFVSTNAID
ncbi:MAG: hypothetical protein MPJ50_08890 [Pirellulales bacterium]|nr:hypothetical protein [Pirellulales bacterium]